MSQFKCDGILGAEFFRDSDASISFNKEKLIIENSKIDFVPTSKGIKSSLEMINEKRKSFADDNVLKYKKIPEIGINILNSNKKISKIKEEKEINGIQDFNSDIKTRLQNLERNILQLKEQLDIRTRLSNIEKQLENFNTSIKHDMIKENIINQKKMLPKIMTTKEIIEESFAENDLFENDQEIVEINLLDLQMEEYNLAMEELEEKAKKEESGHYKPIHLNFCKNLGFDTPKIHHNVVNKSRIDTILVLANIHELNKLEQKALKQVFEKYKDSIYL